MPGVCAVDGGGLVVVRGNALQTGDEDDDVVAEAMPDAHNDDGRHRPGDTAQPAHAGEKFVLKSATNLSKLFLKYAWNVNNIL